MLGFVSDGVTPETRMRAIAGNPAISISLLDQNITVWINRGDVSNGTVGPVSVFLAGYLANTTELAATNFPPRSSAAEQLAAAFLQMRAAVFAKLSGAFACVIVDAEARELFLVSDHLALVPMYYRANGGNLYFSTDAAALLRLCPKQTVRRGKVLSFLSPLAVFDESCSSEDRTFFAEIKCVPSASFLRRREDGRLESKVYWAPPRRLRRDLKSLEDAADEFRATFLAVIDDLAKDQSCVGSDFSGGIDSGSIVFALHERTRHRDVREPIRTYTLYYSSTDSEADVKRIQNVLSQYHSITPTYLLADRYCGPIESGEFHRQRSVPYPCGLNLPESFLLKVNRAADDGCNVLFSGEGADYYLEGTDAIWDSLIRGIDVRRLAREVRALLRRGSLSTVVRYLIDFGLKPLLPKRFSNSFYLKEYHPELVTVCRPEIFTNEFRAELAQLIDREIATLSHAIDFSCWSQRLEHELLFPPLHLWHDVLLPVEIRFPFLERRLLEFGLAIPPEFKFSLLSNGPTHYACRKMLQRRGLDGLVPQEILGAVTKSRYGEPTERRLRIHGVSTFTNPAEVLLCELGIVHWENFKAEMDRLLSAARIDFSDPMFSWLDAALTLEVWLRATADDFADVSLPTW